MEKFIQEIIRQAGAIALRKFGKAGVKYTKAHATDVVTEADLAVNRFLVNAIKKKYPSHGIISEETGEHQPGAEYIWIIDPIDGTRNFAKHAPLFAIMIGLSRKGKMEMAAIYDPCRDELACARKNRGAFLNGKKVTGSKCKTWSESWGIMTSRFATKGRAFVSKLLKHKPRESFWVGSLGSIGVNAIYLAAGRRDWQVSPSGGLWDYAPVALILREAGYKVTNFKGKNWSLEDREMVAAPKQLHKTLLRIIAS